MGEGNDSKPRKRPLWNAVFQDLDRAMAVCGLSGTEQVIMVRARELSLTRAKLKKRPGPALFKLRVARLARQSDFHRVSLSRALARLVHTHVLDRIPGRVGVFRININYHSWSGDHELTRMQRRFADAVGCRPQPPRASVEYNAYLMSADWQTKREAVLKRDGYSCRICSSRRNLHVHHRTYERLGNEDLDDLITLCENCHEMFHVNGKLAKPGG